MNRNYSFANLRGFYGKVLLGTMEDQQAGTFINFQKKTMVDWETCDWVHMQHTFGASYLLVCGENKVWVVLTAADFCTKSFRHKSKLSWNSKKETQDKIFICWWPIVLVTSWIVSNIAGNILQDSFMQTQYWTVSWVLNIDNLLQKHRCGSCRLSCSALIGQNISTLQTSTEPDWCQYKLSIDISLNIL